MLWLWATNRQTAKKITVTWLDTDNHNIRSMGYFGGHAHDTALASCYQVSLIAHRHFYSCSMILLCWKLFLLLNKLLSVIDVFIKVETDNLIKLDIVNVTDNIDGLIVCNGKTGYWRVPRTRYEMDSVCELVLCRNLFFVLLRLFNRLIQCDSFLLYPASCKVFDWLNVFPEIRKLKVLCMRGEDLRPYLDWDLMLIDVYGSII